MHRRCDQPLTQVGELEQGVLNKIEILQCRIQNHNLTERWKLEFLQLQLAMRPKHTQHWYVAILGNILDLDGGDKAE